MKLLKRRRPSGFDPTLGDPEIQQAFERFEAGDWAELEQLLERRSDEWVISTLLHAPHHDVSIDRFEAWAGEAETARAIAHLGRAHLRHSAAPRPLADGEDREQAALERYAALKDAEALICEAIELDPELSEPWVGLMATAQGLRLPPTELHERFVQAHSRTPFRPDACQLMLKSMCERSGGSHDEMFEFARWLKREAPVEAPCQGLLALAHIEYAFADDGTDESEYLQQAEVATELKSLARAYLLATPDGPAATEHLQTVNLFLLAIEPTDGLAGAILRETIGRIDDRPTPLPWSYYEDGIAESFERIRAKRAKAANKA